MDLGPPAGPSHPLGGLNEQTAWAEPCDELADGSSSHHVVPEELEAVLQPFRQGWKVRCVVLVKEVDPQSGGQLSFLMQCEEGNVHGVVVFVCGTVSRGVGGLEGTLIEMRRDAQTEAVGHRVDRATLPLFERQ